MLAEDCSIDVCRQQKNFCRQKCFVYEIIVWNCQSFIFEANKENLWPVKML